MVDIGNIILVVLMGLLLRWSAAFHEYSGKGVPPMYGDYEAQRHWMEITVNLPIKEWYFQTADNDLLYWGLDYPPLTAYHSWINGKIASFINHDWVALNTSRGYESDKHKLFMRSTVMFSDLLTYIPAVVVFALSTKTSSLPNHLKPPRYYTPCWAYITSLDLLLYPGLILIDHGHFQYNCVSLGLAIMAITAALKNYRLTSSVLFVLALSYKQMLLYYALPFFTYFLSQCYFIYKNGKNLGIQALAKVSLTVVMTFFIVWYPFITDLTQLRQVLHRIFPVSRGLFEDKVANVWCIVNIIYKIKDCVPVHVMAATCSFLTLIFSLPSCLLLFYRPSQKDFILCLINVSFAFFLFSFQVHEKTILVVAVPIIMYCPYSDFHCLWFALISTFSMFPLLYKDGLSLPFLSFSLLYVLIENNFINASDTSRAVNPICKYTGDLRWTTLLRTSFIGCVVLCALHVFCPPPASYPDIFPLLIALYSVLHFLYFFVYFYAAQVFSREPSEWELNDRPKCN